jgi:sugar/nucleoside kinase (ribokinase family)
MDPGGRRISFLMQGPLGPTVDYAALETAIAAADVVYLGVVDYARHLVPLVRQRRRPIWTDLHDYDGSNPYFEDFIEAAEVVLLSADRLSDPRAVMTALRNRGKRLVVCTLGERGAFALTSHGLWYEIPAEPAEVIDTNGAGDAFAAGLLVAELRGLPLEDALGVAARTAALAIGSRELAAPDLRLELVLGERTGRLLSHPDQG